MSYSACARWMQRDIAVCRLCRSRKDKSGKINIVSRGQTISFSFPPFEGWVRRIILACTGIYLAQLILDSVFHIAFHRTEEWFALVPVDVLHGEIWQLVTYSLAHVNFP